MSKERLEEIKHYTKIWKNYDFDGNVIEELFMLPKKDFYWIVERVQELNKELNKQVEIGYKIEGKYHDEVDENKRYREALDFYAKRNHYSLAYWKNGSEENVLDYGDVARKALEDDVE